MPRPRKFNHPYIYVDDRKEELLKMEEKAKRELGMLPPQEADMQRQAVRNSYSRRRVKRSGRRKSQTKRSVSTILLLLLIMVLAFFWYYLQKS